MPQFMSCFINNPACAPCHRRHTMMWALEGLCVRHTASTALCRHVSFKLTVTHHRAMLPVQACHLLRGSLLPHAGSWASLQGTEAWSSTAYMCVRWMQRPRSRVARAFVCFCACLPVCVRMCVRMCAGLRARVGMRVHTLAYRIACSYSALEGPLCLCLTDPVV